MRDANVLDRERIESHHLRGDRVDRGLVRRSEHDVFDLGEHRARPRTVPRGRAVHDGEDPRVDLFLNREEVDERAVDPRVGVVPVVVEKTPERVFHRARRRRIDVTLDGGKVDDVLPEKEIRNVNPVREDRVENVHLRFRREPHPAHVGRAEVVADGNVVRLQDREVVVQVLALERVGDDRLILYADQVRKPGPLERANRPLELPRRGVGGREREVPRDVVLEDRRRSGGQRLAQPCELAQARDVFEDACRFDA